MAALEDDVSERAEDRAGEPKVLLDFISDDARKDISSDKVSRLGLSLGLESGVT